MKISLLGSAFVALASAQEPLGHFFRTVTNRTASWPLAPGSDWMDGIVHYRLLPGVFPKGMDYHFDGLAVVMSFRFQGDTLQMDTVRFKSEAEQDYQHCFFYGSGTTHLGEHLCFKNPAVNLLPIEDQLWLTIDTFAWGRVDPLTLDTLAAKTNVSQFTLNAHPACDPVTRECFAQHPCPKVRNPISSDSCFSKIKVNDVDLETEEYSHATTGHEMLLQHSHSPCITPNYLVSKMDSFQQGTPTGPGGLLGFAHQFEGNSWLVMDRRTNASRLMTSNVKFVNNHFWNCHEKDGYIVVDTVTATEDYLDNYYRETLSQPANWTKILYRPQRCLVPFTGDQINCVNLLQDNNLYFDYPTFNQKFKMNPDYQYYYGIAPHYAPSSADRWFTRILKFNSTNGAILKEWSEENVYVTEADFIPRSATTGAEDDGVLVSVVYNGTSNISSLIILDASDLVMVGQYTLPEVVPFHAHGIHCRSQQEGGRCYPNP